MERKSDDWVGPSRQEAGRSESTGVDAVSGSTRFALRIPSLYSYEASEGPEGSSLGSEFLRALNAPKMPKAPGRAQSQSRSFEKEGEGEKEPIDRCEPSNSQCDSPKKEALQALLAAADTVSGATLSSLFSAGAVSIRSDGAERA